MLKLLITLCHVIIFLFCVKFCYASGRHFRGAYTTTVTQTRVSTSLVPSSCILIAPSVPPCRDVRYMKFPALPALSFNYAAKEEPAPNWKAEPEIETTPLGWGEYFGIFAPTVTATTTEFVVTTVQDPSVVVTFAIKGCLPLRPPMDMDRCPQEYESPILIQESLQTSTIPLPVIPTETLLPTKTMSVTNNPSSTIYGGLSDYSEKQPDFQDNLNLLEPSTQEQTENVLSQPTEPL